jgi:serine/threonine protein kinase
MEGVRTSDLIMDFSGFKRVRELGRGGFGVVDLMEDNEKKQIAVKHFQAGPGFNCERIVHEVEALGSLKHP